ncbi:hypothetical protein FB567DRAFT_514046 [Paraphoma chrysanthemicola]|uniref:NACHT domain-containing protein n=1 Tax=Paraphoma chrysanthemicola TaxID=798071 RepID=A0A8K0RLK3_9PLEO|nr:hypothetical protein FB567DRAFT_514046 [Paraphoma chrysanthemicola]
MAMILSKAARLKPEIRLAEAISQFEADLPTAQKTDFQQRRARLLKSGPDMSDVMRLTAEIDRKIAHGRRCLGPRFTSFLSSVQQFAAIGDVVVGGSQNIVACGVWSVVRMSILAVTKHSSYMESLSLAFMEIGRSSPRYQELAVVYSRSQALQAYINEYFIVVVRFCQSIMRFAQKSAIGQLASTLSDATITNTQSELRSWSREIKNEMRLLLAKRVEDEADQNSRFRSLSTKWSKKIAHQQQLAVRLRILNSCSTYEHETTWKQFRRIGNTTLFIHAPEYQTWKNRDSSSTLLYFGMLGCGKSVTMANMVDDLNLSAKSTATSVVYFFVQYGHATSLEARTIIGSITRQILQSASDLSDTPEADEGSLDTESMIALVLRLISPKRKLYVLVDGLDLCTHSAQQEVVEFLRGLQAGCSVCVCISSRLDPSIENDPILQGLQSVQVFRSPDNHRDMEEFISVELSRCLQSRALVLGDPTLVLNIQDALLAGAKGMFLWVALQINCICSLQTDDEIRTALAHLPNDLSETYARIVHSRRAYAAKYQRRIFEFIAAAERPLKTREIQEALSVAPGDTTWSASKLINDVSSALASCGCLVAVDEDELTVRFVHPTVQQYLFEQYENPLGKGVSAASCHAALADVIVTYLSYGVFGTDVSTFRMRQIDVGDAPAQIVGSALSRGGVQTIALNLLKMRRKQDVDIGKVVAQEMSARKTMELPVHLFFLYAEQYCFHHVRKAARPFSTHVLQLYPRVFEKMCLAGFSKHPSHHDHSSGATYNMKIATQHLRLARNTGSPNKPDLELLRLVIPTFFDHTQMRKAMEIELNQAICEGDSALNSLLDEHYDLEINWWTYLIPTSKFMKPCLFAYKGDVKCLEGPVRAFVEQDRTELSDAAIHHRCASGRTLLECAIWGHNIPMIEVLLQDPRIDINVGAAGKTLVWHVVKQGWPYDLAVQIFGTNRVQLRDGEGTALLAHSRELGHEELTRLFHEVASYNSSIRAFSVDIMAWTVGELSEIKFRTGIYRGGRIDVNNQARPYTEVD